MTLRLQKEIGLCVSSLLLSFLLFLLLISSSASFVYPGLLITAIIILTFLWISITSVSLALIKNGLCRVTVLIGPPIIAILVAKINLIAVIAAAVFAMLITASRYTFMSKMANQIKFRPWHVFYKGIWILMFGLAIVLLAVTVPLYFDAYNPNIIMVPEATLHTLITASEPFLTKVYPGLTADTTADEFISIQVAQQYPDLNPNGPVASEMKQQLLRQFSQKINYPLYPSDTLSKVIAVKLNNSLSSATTRNPVLSSIILMLSLLLLLRLIIPTLAVLATVFTIFTLWLGRQLNLFVLTEKQVQAEQIQL